MTETPRTNTSGQKFFGDKDLKYLKKVSREAVEKHTDTSVLYFGVDYENSVKNFYGELTVKKWLHDTGVEIKGVIDLTQSEGLTLERVPNKLTQLTFSCYIDQLQELDIEPRIGDYLAVKNRFYMIYDRTILDANEVAIGVDREAFSIRYKCMEADEEEILPEVHSADQTRGSKDEIEGRPEVQL